MKFLLFILSLCITITGISQVLSNTGIVASIATGTVVNIGSVGNTSGTLTNNGTLTIASHYSNGGTGSGSGNYNIAGNFTNTGTFTASAGTITFNGTSIQNFTGVSSFYNLTLNNANGILLNNDLTINGATNLSSGNLSIASNTLVLNGALSGSGTLTGSSTSNLTIGGTAGTVNFTTGFRTLKNLSLSSGATATLGTLLDIVAGAASGTLVVNSGATLTTSGNLTLKSNATGTARVGSSAGTVSGNVTVERYVPGRRKYRLITSSVTTSTSTTLTTGQEGLSIWGNWQNQANNTTGNVGNFITGGTSANGYDQQTSNPSLFTYDDANRQYVGFTSANGKNTKYTPLKAGVPYYMFVYGDRLNSIITNTPNVTVLKATGTLLIGDQTYNTSSSLPLSNVTGRFTLIGNPFASPISWASLPKTNIADTYWGWDPNLAGTGGYVTVNTAGTVTLIAPYSGTVGLNQYIQSGQGFFVKTTAASPSLTIREQDKVSNFNANAFRGTASNSLPLIAINLLYDNAGTSTLADGVIDAYDPTFSNNAGKEDAAKINSNTEAVAIKIGNDLYSIEGRNMPADNDTLFLNVLKLTKPQYTLQIFAQQLDTTRLQPYLQDMYLKTITPLSIYDTNKVVFTVITSDASSSSPSRFNIVFRKLSADPVNFISLQANQHGDNVQVDWEVSGDSGIVKYNIERSTGNAGFTKVGEVTANGKSRSHDYLFEDVNPPAQDLWYRLRLIHADGNFTYSKTVSIKVDENKADIKIFPNPVTEKRIYLQLNEIEQGEYALIIINTQGQQVMRQTIQHPGGSSKLVISLDKRIPAGIYYLQLANKKSSYTQRFFVE